MTAQHLTYLRLTSSKDIKPENVVFKSSEKDSSIRLIDFGLVTTRVGACQYASPELIKGRYDRATDVWSIGVLTYILFCGYVPLNGKDDVELAKAIITEDCVFVYGWESASAHAVDFIKCLLNPDSRNRLTADEALVHPWLEPVLL
jgi:serine/threonine protein kinase